MLRRRLLLLPLLLAGCGGARSAAECGDLRLSSDHGEIEARFTVRREVDWRLVVVHEGHVAWRGAERGPFTVTHRMKDYAGSDRVVVRATDPRGEICARSGMLAAN